MKICLNLAYLNIDMANFKTCYVIALLLINFTKGLEQKEKNMNLEGIRQKISRVSCYN